MVGLSPPGGHMLLAATGTLCTGLPPLPQSPHGPAHSFLPKCQKNLSFLHCLYWLSLNHGWAGVLRQDPPPPLELSFLLFPTFLYHVKEESQTNLLMKTAWRNSNGKLTKLSLEFDVFSIFESRNRCARWAAAQRAVIRIDQGKSRWVAVGMLKCTVIGRPTCSLTVPPCHQVAFEWCLSPKERYHLALLVSSSRRLCAPGTLAGGSEFVEAELLTKLLIEQGSSPCAPVKRDLQTSGSRVKSFFFSNERWTFPWVGIFD